MKTLKVNTLKNVSHQDIREANFVYKKFPFGIIYIYKNRFAKLGWSHKLSKTWKKK